MSTFFSGMAGGGVYGTVAGIAHIITTGVGVIMIVSQFSISISTQVGGDIIETITGKDAGGATNVFPISDFIGTGKAGKMIDVGKGEEPGASLTINIHHKNRGRN